MGVLMHMRWASWWNPRVYRRSGLARARSHARGG